MLSRPWAFVRHMNKHCVVFGRRGLAAAMRNQVEPSRSDGLFAAGALWVGGHCFSLPSASLSAAIILRVFHGGEPLFTEHRRRSVSAAVRITQSRGLVAWCR